MNKDIILIIRSSDTLWQVKEELSKPLGFLKFKEKKEMKDLESQIRDKINSIVDHDWTVSYLYDLQNALLVYKNKLSSSMEGKFYISEVDENKNNKSSHPAFCDMYFFDIERNNKIILSITGDNINFTIFDEKLGNTFTVSSENSVQKSQKKIESVCKQRIIETLLNYLDKEGREKNNERI